MAVRGSKRARRQPAQGSAVDLVTQLRKEMVLNHGEFSRHLSGLRDEHNKHGSAITLCMDRLIELERFFDPYSRSKPCLPAAVASLQKLTEETAEHVTTLQTIAKKSNHAGSVMADLAAQIDHTNARLDKFERGLDQLLEQVAGSMSDMPPMPAPPPPRVLKGGWVNVYMSCPDLNSPWGSFATFYDTKEEADAAACDNRIACILLPDITEGDGL